MTGFTQRWSKQKLQQWLMADKKSTVSSRVTLKSNLWWPHRSPAQQNSWSPMKYQRLWLIPLHYIRQCACEKARTEVRSAVHDVVEKILFDLLHRKAIDKILDKHIVSFFDSSGSADNMGDKLLSTYAFMALITAFIQRRTGKAIAAECVSTKMDKQLK